MELRTRMAECRKEKDVYPKKGSCSEENGNLHVHPPGRQLRNMDLFATYPCKKVKSVVYQKHSRRHLSIYV